ncbi:hypothetical protein LWI29_009308 [Acer saccharum]|uniref:Uncharacterized protein n=1 Tax=Acer saccharum TaxID=4024 RepID=A0AA39SK94_ACESA|nr:hypothetical protein LWI29_009308 [Acer saccharum]
MRSRHKHSNCGSAEARRCGDFGSHHEKSPHMLPNCGDLARSYVVKVEEDVIPVDIEWIERLLALRKETVQNGRNHSSEKENFQICWPNELGVAVSKLSTSYGKVRGDSVMFCQGNKADRTLITGRIGQGKLEKKKRGLVVKKRLDKGKKKWIKKSKAKPPDFLIQNGKLTLEKRRCDRIGDRLSSESSSSSEGECSSLKEKGSGAVMDGPISLRPKKVSFKVSSDPNSFKNLIAKERVDICVDLGSLVESPVAERSSKGWVKPKVVVVEENRNQTPDGEEDSTSIGTISNEVLVQAISVTVEGEPDRNGVAEVLSNGNSGSKEEMVRATIEVEKNSAVGLTEITSAVEERTGSRHGLRQNSRSKSKVSSSHGMRTRNSLKSGSVEEEAAKTVELGIALGFDFSEVEDEVLEEITRREKEDIARFEAISG